MIQLWRTKKELADASKQDDINDMQVKQLKKRTHRQIIRTDETAKNLNKILKANGITLKIYIARGGHYGR